MPLDALTGQVRERIAAGRGAFPHTLLFDFGAEGVIFIDGTTDPATIDNERRTAEAVFTLAPRLFAELLAGRSAMLAYMTGKLKISGSTRVAMELAALL
jgi:putative sterol carrier protein